MSSFQKTSWLMIVGAYGDYHNYHECAGNSYDNHSFSLLFDMKDRFSKARSADVLRRHRVADLLVFRSPFEGLAPTAQSRVHGKELLLESMQTASKQLKDGKPGKRRVAA